MPSPESITGPLGELTGTFEGCVLWAVRAVMESDVGIKAPFELVKSVPSGSSLYCILPTGNLKFHAQLVVGVEEDEIADLFPGETDPKVRKDAIGEMANVISGLFVADDRFLAGFGSLRPSSPFFSEGAFTAREDWSLKGVLEVNGKTVMLAFSIREVESETAAEQMASGAPNPEGRPD